eukprot:7973732-Prorocentrum_lima.AAC.1
MLQRIPTGALCLLVAGTPCQQLTTMGRFQGRQGLGGTESRHFFALPYVARLIQQERPDLATHTLLEHTASMRPMHRARILEAMGLTGHARSDMQVDAGSWTAFPRRRILISTLPIPAAPWRPAPRPHPWESGYQPHPQGEMPAILRARGESAAGLPRPSAYQLAARCLLYHNQAPWRDMSLYQ